MRVKKATLVILFLAAVAGTAQEQTPVFRTNSRLVLLDVVVTGKAGRPVRGLKQSDFTVMEDGVAQQITSFTASQTPASSTPQPGNGARNIILLDQLNIQFQDLAYARDQMSLFLKTHPVEQQPTALMTIGRRGLAMIQDFTQESSVLNDKLAHLPALLANPADGYADPMLAREHAQDALRALAQIANAAVGYPFRLNVIWVSSGFAGMMTSSASGDLDSGLHRLANLLIRSRMSLYTIDPAGVVQESSLVSKNPVVSGKSREAMQSAAQQFDRASTNQQLSADQFMSQLTRLMGGVSYFNRNDVNQALSRAMDDGSSAYALTYSPSNSDFQGGYRKIEVRINVEGATARTRPGYYASATSVSADDGSRDDRLQVALESPIPYVAFHLACSLTYDPAARRLQGKLSSSPELRLSGTDQNQQIVLAASFSERDKLLSKWSWLINWKTPWTNHPVSTLFDKVLPKDTRRVRFVVADPDASRIGTCEYRIP